MRARLSNIVGVILELILMGFVMVLASHITNKAPLTERRRFHHQARRMPESPWGGQSWGFGLKFGYWPCLKAPYVQIAFLFWRLEIWHGLAGKTKADTTERFNRHLVEIASNAAYQCEDTYVSAAHADELIAQAQRTFV